ncbi:hypothetical protein LAWASA_3783 [Lawsonibacter asaccharolyticus]|nr:hypothetical protein LAWASA_3783 [Lawsonibacter asaccharolyticus]
MAGEAASSSGASGSHRLQCLPPDRTCHVRFSIVEKNDLLRGVLTDPTSVPAVTGSGKDLWQMKLSLPLFFVKKTRFPHPSRMGPSE